MVNVYTEYFKELIDFLFGVILSSVQSTNTLDVKYLFSDYKLSFGQQAQLIDTLSKAGVIKIVHKIPLPPLIKFTLNTSGNEYSATGCLGYELELNKDEFLQYRANNPIFKLKPDDTEVTIPKLVEDGEVLVIGTDSIKLRSKGRKTHAYILANAVFGTEDMSCGVEVFILEAYDRHFEDMSEKERDALLKSALTNFNLKVRIPNFLSRNGKLIVYDGPGSNNREKFRNLD